MFDIKYNQKNSITKVMQYECNIFSSYFSWAATSSSVKEVNMNSYKYLGKHQFVLIFRLNFWVMLKVEKVHKGFVVAANYLLKSFSQQIQHIVLCLLLALLSRENSYKTLKNI